MKKFTVEIECENDAFTGGIEWELAWLLMELSINVRRGRISCRKSDSLAILDVSGNRVGTAKFEDK